MWKTKAVPVLLWLVTLFAVWVVLLGISHSDAEAVIIFAGFGSVLLCFFAPFLAAYYAKAYPWCASLTLAGVVVAAVYANIYAAHRGGTFYTHPLDYVWLLVFCIPGTVSLGFRWMEGSNERASDIAR